MTLVRYRIILFILSILFLSGCSYTQKIGELTSLQKAELAVREGKKAEQYYRDVVILYNAIYNEYQANPTSENKSKLEKIGNMHDKIYGLYEKFRTLHNNLISAIKIKKELNADNDSELDIISSHLMEILRQMVIESPK